MSIDAALRPSDEEWRSVAGWEGSYEVSSAGRVRSLTRRVNSPNGGRLVVGHLTKPKPINSGYLIAPLNRDNRITPYLVHRLVAGAFLGQCPDGLDVNHKNMDKTDNRASNLEYMTRSQNILHAVAHGIGRGERNGTARLTDVSIVEMRRKYRHGGGPGYKALAKEYGVPWGTIRNVITRRTWAWLEE